MGEDGGEVETCWEFGGVHPLQVIYQRALASPALSGSYAIEDGMVKVKTQHGEKPSQSSKSSRIVVAKPWSRSPYRNQRFRWL